jgi:hypothetical protein
MQIYPDGEPAWMSVTSSAYQRAARRRGKSVRNCHLDLQWLLPPGGGAASAGRKRYFASEQRISDLAKSQAFVTSLGYCRIITCIMAGGTSRGNLVRPRARDGDEMPLALAPLLY